MAILCFEINAHLLNEIKELLELEKPYCQEQNREINRRYHAPRTESPQYERLHIGEIHREQKTESYNCLNRPERN